MTRIKMLATDSLFGVILGERMIRTHDETMCAGEFCAIHAPSDHLLRDAPKLFRADRDGLIERLCRHGIGHSDPDSVQYLESIGVKEAAIHGCDGCCQKTEDGDR